jgi:hypothetical protein
VAEDHHQQRVIADAVAAFLAASSRPSISGLLKKSLPRSWAALASLSRGLVPAT